MGMMTSDHSLTGIIHIINTLNGEGDILKFLQRYQLTTLVSMRLENILYHLHYFLPP